MKSTAATVAEYLDEQRAEWQPTLRKLRAACRRELKGYMETMMAFPAFKEWTEAGLAETIVIEKFENV